MEQWAFFALILNMVYFISAVLIGWGILRFLDRLSGIAFQEAIFHMKENRNYALAIYFGARLIGICILAAAFVR